jgi:hypothetical protein
MTIAQADDIEREAACKKKKLRASESNKKNFKTLTN